MTSHWHKPTFSCIHARLLLALFVCFGSLAAAAPRNQSQQHLERLLNDRYRGLILTLRRFASGSKLIFNADGNALRGGPVGPWTLYGKVKIQRLKMRHDRLEVDARRWVLVYDPARRKLTGSPGDKLKIEIDLSGSAPDLASIERTFQEIFLTPQESLAEYVPDYWKPYLQGKTVWPPHRPSQGMENPCGPGVHETLPSAILKPEPPYIAKARDAMVQGTVAFSLVVDRSGSVRELEVVKPIGMGLDDSAASTISGWKFKPATCSGVPTPVHIFTQISFRAF